LGAAAVGVVGDGAAGQPGRAGQSVGDAFDEAEGGGGGAEGGGEEVGEQSGGDLVADIGQEAGRADAGYPRSKPALPWRGRGIGHGGSLPQRSNQAPAQWLQGNPTTWQTAAERVR
jgi:hypothetical protein